MQLRAKISLPSRYEGDELTKNDQPLRQVTTNTEMEDYEPPLELSESDFDGAQPKRKRVRPPSRKKKVHFQEPNGAVDHHRVYRRKAPIIEKEQDLESRDQVSSSSLKGQSPSRYQRRKDYKPMLRRLGSILYDQNGNPQHGIGDLLEERDRAANAKKHSRRTRLNDELDVDERLSEGLQRKEMEYEKRYLGYLEAPSRVQMRYPIMPEDLTAQLESSPVNFFAFQDEMATSSDDEDLGRVLKYEEVSSCDIVNLSQLTTSQKFFELHPTLQWHIVNEIEEDFERTHHTEQLPAHHAAAIVLGEGVRNKIDAIIKNGQKLRNTPTALPSTSDVNKAIAFLNRRKLAKGLVQVFDTLEVE
jgi:hypothetical protein